jgi:putative redox protein
MIVSNFRIVAALLQKMQSIFCTSNSYHMQIEKIEIPSSKGYISAVLNYPAEQTDKLAILCPGFLDTKDYAHLKNLAERLCEQNYTVARFDPTGTWESSGKIEDYTTTQYLDDIKTSLDFMFAKYEYKNILLGGHSRGGQNSILYAARDQRITMVLGIFPSAGRIGGSRRSDWEKLGVSVSFRDNPQSLNRVEFRVPYSHVLDRDKYDALGDVKNIHCPIIFFAGEKDEIVDPEDVKKLYDNANHPKSFVVIEDIGHDYRFNEREIELVNQKVLEEINKF